MRKWPVTTGIGSGCGGLLTSGTYGRSSDRALVRVVGATSAGCGSTIYGSNAERYPVSGKRLKALPVGDLISGRPKSCVSPVDQSVNLVQV